MPGHTRRSFPAAMLATLIGGMLTGAPAGAQSVPVPAVPGIGSAIAGCAVLAGLSPCLDAAVPPNPVVIGAGGAIGGRLPIGGGRNVDVDKDVDRYRQPARVFVEEQ